MLGKGWFPDQLGGLDRYYRDLLEHDPAASGVLIGPASDRPARVTAVSDHDASLPRRLFAFAAACRRAAGRADLVDAHFALYAALPLLSRRVRSLPLVVHFQGPWADENVAQGDGSPVRRSLRRAVERMVYRRATRVVVLSSAFRRVLVERYGISPWRIRVEPPGVDLDRFCPGDRQEARRRFGLQECPFTAVCVRRLVSRMGLDILIDAWDEALPLLPAGATLLIAGDGELRAELEARILSRGLAESVRLLGRIDDEALVDLYRAADVGVVPTRSFEGFGLVVIEAAGCGTPTIVTRVGGLPEAVAKLDPSLVVPPNDVAALAARISDASAGGLPTCAATRIYAEEFSWGRVVNRHRAIHREALRSYDPHDRIRVVYLDHVAQLSGGEIALLRLVPYLAGVEAHIILAEDGPFAEQLVQAGVSTEVLPMSERARGLRKGRIAPRSLPIVSLVKTVSYIVRLAVRLRRLQPDIVHTNSLKAGVYGSIAGRLAGIPVVWHVRDRIADDYLPKFAVRLVRFMTRKLASAVVTNSHATMDTLDPQVQPVIVYSVVPEALLPPVNNHRCGAGPITIGMIGRLAPWKGQELFLRAFADAFPDGETRCVVVGSAMFGEDDYEARLRELSDSLGLATRVEFRGFSFDVWGELAKMHILVHASLIPEPFGQVILEGMAASVPVVAAGAGGPAELIVHDVSGLLYPMGDQAALAQAMRELAGDEERRERLVMGGLEMVAMHHPDTVAAQMDLVYRGVLGTAATGL
jgi:glycosyltransferase involved in cell wall biosynthesis